MERIERGPLGVDSEQLLALEREAVDLGFDQCWSPDELRPVLAPDALHYLVPAVMHAAFGRPDDSAPWRCAALLTVRDGTRVLSLLDVQPATFARLPDTLSPTQQAEAADSVLRLPSLREWLADHA